jgi:hypothetical protein
LDIFKVTHIYISSDAGAVQQSSKKELCANHLCISAPFRARRKLSEKFLSSASRSRWFFLWASAIITISIYIPRAALPALVY